MLEDLDEALNAQGTSLVFAELKDPVRDKIERYGLTRTIDPRHFFLGEPPFAAFREDHPMLLWLSDRSQPAADFVKQYLLTHSAAGNNISGNAVTVSASGLKAVYAGAASAAFYGVPNSDPRHPDVTGIAQHGVVYTGGEAKIAEHGGDDPQDRNVPILVVSPTLPHGATIGAPVETTQIAPTILTLLGLSPEIVTMAKATRLPVIHITKTAREHSCLPVVFNVCPGYSEYIQESFYTHGSLTNGNKQRSWWTDQPACWQGSTALTSTTDNFCRWFDTPAKGRSGVMYAKNDFTVTVLFRGFPFTAHHWQQFNDTADGGAYYYQG